MEAMDNTGQYVVVNKHRRRKNGSKRRRVFYSADVLQAAYAEAARLAGVVDDDFLVLQVVGEASRTCPAGTGPSAQGRST
jgi:hypothetical protein